MEEGWPPPTDPPPYLEVQDLVAFAQRDLEHVHGANKGRQPGQALLATPTHPHQQRVAPWGLQDAIDAAAVGKEAEAPSFSQAFCEERAQ